MESIANVPLQLFPVFYLVFAVTVVSFAAGVFLLAVDRMEARREARELLTPDAGDLPKAA